MTSNPGQMVNFRLSRVSALLIMLSGMAGCGGGGMESDVMNSYLPDKIEDWRATDESESYDRDGIFKYIDGAGEVYRQYDYRRVIVKRYSGNCDFKVTVELFDMGKPEDAFGIFSHSRETSDAGFGQGSEFNSGLLCFWKSRYFVCLYSEQQNNDSDEAVRHLAAKIDSLIPPGGNVPKIVDMLPRQGLAGNRVRFFHRYESLGLHYYLADDNILDLGHDTNVVFAEYRPDAARLLLIEYPDNKSAQAALVKFRTAYIPGADSTGSERLENGKWALARKTDRFAVIILDAPDKAGALVLYEPIEANLRELAEGKEAARE